MNKNTTTIPQQQINEIALLAFTTASATKNMRKVLSRFSEILVDTDLSTEAKLLFEHARQTAEFAQEVADAVSPHADFGSVKKRIGIH